VSARALGAAVAAAVVVADQAAKAVVLWRLTEGPSIPLAPFLNLTLRWNRGISFSLFTQGSDAGRDVLLALTLAATALLGWWLARVRSYLAAIGLGAIIGGALGNAADRATHGAVVDFLDLHAFGTHFFVFNLADAAINIGVALLLVDLVFVGHVSDEKKRPISQDGRG